MKAVKEPSTSYDQTFMTDRASLRPHYRGLLEAYEDEFHSNKGMRDEKLIAFLTTMYTIPCRVLEKMQPCRPIRG